MEKVLLPMMIQDHMLTDEVEKRAEGFWAYEPYFLDGPISERVAIIDFDEQTGLVREGARFHKEGNKLGKYVDERGVRIDFKLGRKTRYRTKTRAFNQVSVFATVLRTMKLFEDEKVLCRKLSWAFDSPQLLVVPRAGVWANAFYDRNTQSLQFFYFKSKQTGETIYSSLSRDIVSHEAAHAIFDGIAPDLYHAITPQSQALHETVADITAVLMALKSHNLMQHIVRSTNGKIGASTEFSRIGEEFGRNLKNSPSLRELSEQNKFDAKLYKPHKLSVILSATLFNLLLKIYNDWWAIEKKEIAAINKEDIRNGKEPTHTKPTRSSANRALLSTIKDFTIMVLGALDFLPPGEISFTDFGRALYANQQNIVKFTAVSKVERDRAKKRIKWLIETYQEASIIKFANEINESRLQGNPLVKTNFYYDPLSKTELEEILKSDWAAYQFANNNRSFLGIPTKIPFDVRPRLESYKQLNLDDDEIIMQRQVIFKVSWSKNEKNVVSSSGFPRSRRITVGTTLVIDADSKKVIARLHTDSSDALIDSRTEMVKHLDRENLIRFDEEALGPNGEPLNNFVQAKESKGVLKLTGVSRMLHIIDS